MQPYFKIGADIMGLNKTGRAQRGFIGGYIAAGVAVAALMGSMAMSNMQATRANQAITQRSLQNAQVNQALLRVAREGQMTTGNSFLAPPPVRASQFTEPGSGKAPNNLGLLTEANSTKYCVWDNGNVPERTLAEDQVAPVRINTQATYWQIREAPVVALISGNRNGVELNCSDLTKEVSGITLAKSAQEIRDTAQEKNSNDQVDLRTMAAMINEQGEGAANLVQGTTDCPFETHKLVYRPREGGGTEFVCVPEQDPAVAGQNLGAGGQLYAGKDFVPNETDAASVVSRLKFRGLIGGGGITVTTEGDNVRITGSTAAQSAGGGGVSLVNANGQVVRLIAGGNINVVPSSDGNGVILSATIPSLNGLITNASNAGTGPGQVFQGVSGSSLAFRSLRSADERLQITTVGNEVVFTNSGAVSANGALNVGAVIAANSNTQDTASVKSIFLGKQTDNTLLLRRLQSGIGISITEGDADPANPTGPKTLRISSDVVAGGGITGLQNVGTGPGQIVRQGAVGGIISVRTLAAGNGVTITTQGDNVIISANTTGGVQPPSQACGPNQKLIWAVSGGVGGLQCVDETDARLTALLPVGGACSATQVLTYDGTRLVCVAGSTGNPGASSSDARVISYTSPSVTFDFVPDIVLLTGRDTEAGGAWLMTATITRSDTAFRSFRQGNQDNAWSQFAAKLENRTVTIQGMSAGRLPEMRAVAIRLGSSLAANLPNCTDGQFLTVNSNGTLTCNTPAGGGSGPVGSVGQIDVRTVTGLRASGTVTVALPFTPDLVLVSGRDGRGEQISGTVAFRQGVASQSHIFGGRDNGWAQFEGSLNGTTLTLDSWSVDVASVIAIKSGGANSRIENIATNTEATATSVNGTLNTASIANLDAQARFIRAESSCYGYDNGVGGIVPGVTRVVFKNASGAVLMQLNTCRIWSSSHGGGSYGIGAQAGNAIFNEGVNQFIPIPTGAVTVEALAQGSNPTTIKITALR